MHTAHACKASLKTGNKTSIQAAFKMADSSEDFLSTVKMKSPRKGVICALSVGIKLP
jgi:hypothetical protein